MITDLHYLAPVRMPTEKAHGLQIMQNCEAFAHTIDGQVTLHPSNRRQQRPLRGRDPFDYYGVPRDFAIDFVPTLDLMPLANQRPWAERIAFAGILASNAAGLWWQLRGADAGSVFYSRHRPMIEAVRRFKPARRVFWEVHALSPNEKRRRDQAELVNQIGGAITITQHMANTLIDLGASPDRIMVAPDGIRAARFADMPSRAEARAIFNLPEGAFMVGYMGRLHTLNMEKGVGDIIRAIASKPDLPLHMLLVGGPDDMVDEYRAEWTRIDLPAERFHSLGQLPAVDVPTALASFDVCAMPHPWTEYFAYYLSALKLFEYMATQRPIVATSLPSTQEILTDGENALLVPPSDVDALAGAFQRLYETPALGTQLAQLAHEQVFSQYTWSARARYIVDFMAARI